MTAMQEFVVPKSMPNTFAIKSFWLKTLCLLLPSNDGAVALKIVINHCK